MNGNELKARGLVRLDSGLIVTAEQHKSGAQRLQTLGRAQSGKAAGRSIAPAKLSTNPARARIQIVAHAVTHDPALKDKALDALNMLADDGFASVTGKGLVKMLQAGVTASAPSQLTSKAEPTARASDPWGNVIARMNRANGFTN